MEVLIVLGVLLLVLLGLVVRSEMFYAKTNSWYSATTLINVSLQKDLTYIINHLNETVKDLTSSLEEERRKVLLLTEEISQEKTKNKLLEESMEVFTSTLARR